jgi:phosphatidylglycerol:prolipoprotein diacylglycerol transferase
VKALFSTPGLSILGIHVPKLYWMSYPLFFATAFLVTISIAVYEGRKRGLETWRLILIWLLAIAGGLAGARLWYFAIWEHNDLIGYLSAIIDFSKGGLASSGGFLGVFIAAILYAKLSRKNLWPYADMFGIAGGITFAIMRFGCFFQGCCYGAIANLPWSVHYLEALRHPTQLYEIIAGVGIYLYMQSIKTRQRFAGYFFLLLIALYSFIRFFIEFAREEPKAWIFTYSQYIYAVFFIAAVAIIILASKPRKGWQSGLLDALGLHPLQTRRRKANAGKKK